MSKDYPYIQNKEKIKNGICSVCKERKEILRLEWRVDYFQGNCEFEDICSSCLNNRENKLRKEQAEYYRKMEPIWKRQEINRKKKEQKVKEIISNLGFFLQEFGNGQWNIGNKIDWWTTTGTAIERKSGKRYHFSFNRSDEIKKVLELLK